MPPKNKTPSTSKDNRRTPGALVAVPLASIIKKRSGGEAFLAAYRAHMDAYTKALEDNNQTVEAQTVRAAGLVYAVVQRVEKDVLFLSPRVCNTVDHTHAFLWGQPPVCGEVQARDDGGIKLIRAAPALPVVPAHQAAQPQAPALDVAARRAEAHRLAQHRAEQVSAARDPLHPGLFFFFFFFFFFFCFNPSFLYFFFVGVIETPLPPPADEETVTQDEDFHGEAHEKMTGHDGLSFHWAKQYTRVTATTPITGGAGRLFSAQHPPPMRRTEPAINGVAPGVTWTKKQMFLHFFPVSYMRSSVMPELNRLLQDLGQKEADWDEILRYHGVLCYMGTFPNVQAHEFWATAPQNGMPVFNMRQMSKISRDRFKELTSALADALIPSGVDVADPHAGFRAFLEAWNENMAAHFLPSDLLCVDETMVFWTVPSTMPGWVAIPGKPTPRGSYLYALADARSAIMLGFELSLSTADNDFARKLQYSELEEKIPPHVMRLLDSTGFQTGGGWRKVLGDDRFANPTTATLLQQRQLHSCFMTKHQPKGVPVNQLNERLHADTEFGDVLTRHAWIEPPGPSTTLHELAVVGSHDTDTNVVFTTTYGSADLAREPVLFPFPFFFFFLMGHLHLFFILQQTRRNVKGEFKTFYRPQVAQDFYGDSFAHSAVDVHNHISQGSGANMSDIHTTHPNMRLYNSSVGASGANAHLWLARDAEEAQPHREFMRELAMELFHGTADATTSPRKSPRKRPHESEHYILHHDDVPREHRSPTTNRVQERACSVAGCDRRVTTYCNCGVPVCGHGHCLFQHITESEN